MPYNANTAYGRAMLDAIRDAVPTHGRIFIVVNSTDYTDWSYTQLSEVFKPDPDGNVRYFTDLATAYTATQSGNNDVIALAAHTSHKLSSMLTVAKDRVHFFGLDGGSRGNNPRCLISSTGTGVSTDVSLVKVTGTGCSFRNIKFSNGFTVAQNLSAVLEYGNNTLYENCTIHNLGSGHLTNANAAPLILAGGDPIFKNCTIGADTLQSTVASGQVLLIKKGSSAQAATRAIFDHCWLMAYTNKTTHVFVRVAADGDIDRFVHFKNCTFLNFKTGSDGAQMAVACATASGLTSGFLMFEYPAIANATKLATAAVGNDGVLVLGTTATAGSDGIAVQATA